MLLRYITHPNVAVDPAVPVPQWGLSEDGRRRAIAMCSRPWVAAVERIVSSDEVKAVETATLLGERLGIDVEIREGIGENDRSATGFVPPEEFEGLADQFFGNPDASVRGWERAVDAQVRITKGLSDLLSSDAPGDIVVVGHGGVGTLWFCHLSDQAIDRSHDQPGQGHYFTVDRSDASIVHAWRPIDR